MSTASSTGTSNTTHRVHRTLRSFRISQAKSKHSPISIVPLSLSSD